MYFYDSQKLVYKYSFGERLDTPLKKASISYPYICLFSESGQLQLFNFKEKPDSELKFELVTVENNTEKILPEADFLEMLKQRILETPF